VERCGGGCVAGVWGCVGRGGGGGGGGGGWGGGGGGLWGKHIIIVCLQYLFMANQRAVSDSRR